MKIFQKLLNKDIMKAILVREFGGPEVIKLEQNVPIPEPNDDQVFYFLKLLKNFFEANHHFILKDSNKSTCCRCQSSRYLYKIWYLC